MPGSCVAIQPCVATRLGALRRFSLEILGARTPDFVRNTRLLRSLSVFRATNGSVPRVNQEPGPIVQAACATHQRSVASVPSRRVDFTMDAPPVENFAQICVKNTPAHPTGPISARRAQTTSNAPTPSTVKSLWPSLVTAVRMCFVGSMLVSGPMPSSAARAAHSIAAAPVVPNIRAASVIVNILTRK